MKIISGEAGLGEGWWMRSGRRLQALATALTVAVLLAAPATTLAAPQWRLNGLIAGATKQDVVQFGALTLKSKPYGEFKCRIVAGAPVWNESEKGVNAVEGWESSPCSYTGSLTGCKSQPFVTAEGGMELIERINAKSEKEWEAKRGTRTWPWPGELFETSEKTTSLNMQKIKIYVDCPAEGLEVPFEGNLEPKVLNGVKNGLSPSKLVFEGQGGKTSYLGKCKLELCEPESAALFVSGELTILGTAEQLITAGNVSPPTFAGLKSASMCFPGPTMPETAPVHLSWEAATNDVTASTEIVYNVYQATTSGGETYSTPTYTTAPGATEFETPELRTSESHFFVVRARDKAGLEDSNTVETRAENICL